MGFILIIYLFLHFKKNFLTGEIQRKGIIVPLAMDIYQPILSRLKQEGVKAREKITLL